jgi:hypothetical protein
MKAFQIYCYGVRKSYGWEETIERGKAEKMGKSVGWYIRDGGGQGRREEEY